MPLLEDLRHGARIETKEGSNVGRLHSVVIDPSDKEVTHIVVNGGPHFPEPGFGSPELREVPIDSVANADDERVMLNCTQIEFGRLPAHIESDFAPASPVPLESEKQDAAHRLWNIGVALAASFANTATGIAVPADSVRKARFGREILNDVPVWRVEPHTHIGDVERVLVDEETDEIRDLVIRRGGILHHDVLLPIDYVTEILDGVIHVQISDDDLSSLKAY